MSTASCPLSGDPALRAAAWRRSSHSTGTNNCVETAELGSGLLALRDSKAPTGPVLLLSPAAWGSFVEAVRAGSL
ncbi:DUF397 domain-containing protein [Streptomyces varsoviensis]|uniref:DUF397 domain-containing protein n=1 Tax=Streptomyces varsoviensis TaxID=67373 RepID=A0ABR5J680_9ACTN|nr:DUF397 domain-containing protein [Streptomyces varsoviensis]KOG88866.1 hypothetical protein ADK38_17400 [Streptomyces varsoviensis]